MISGDPTFTGIGTVTRIDYMDRFFRYKNILGRNAQTPEVISLLNSLNQELFGIVPDSNPSPRTSIPRLPAEDASLTRLLQSFQAQSVPQDDSTPPM
jgi:hypothetical protein